MKRINNTLYYATDKLKEVIEADLERLHLLNAQAGREHRSYDDKELFLSLESRVRRAINFNLYGVDTDQYMDPVKEEGVSNQWQQTSPVARE